MLMQVTKAWELPVTKFDEGPTAIIEQPEITVRGTQIISNKLDAIQIPRINFTDSSIAEAIGFLRKRAAELDDSETDPDLKGSTSFSNFHPAPPIRPTRSLFPSPTSRFARRSIMWPTPPV